MIGLDTVGGTVGWLLQTDAHELRGVRAKGATEAGIEIAGNGNRVSWNLVNENGVGIKVSGSGNDLRGGTVEKNVGDGVQFSATAQGNVLHGADVLLNGGNGILIEGFGNTVRDNPRVDNNGKNGVLVTGSGNLIKGNVAGSAKKKGNAEDGFARHGRRQYARQQQGQRQSRRRIRHQRRHRGQSQCAEGQSEQPRKFRREARRTRAPSTGWPIA